MWDREFEELRIDLSQSRPVRPGPSGETKTFCPECHHRRNDQRDRSLSVNVIEGIFNCHYCQWGGSVKGGSVADSINWERKPKRTYTKPEPVLEVTRTEPMLAWFKKRGIEPDVLEKHGIYRDEQGIVFPFILNGELVNRKTRLPDRQEVDKATGEIKTHKDFRLVSGAEVVMYNADACRGEKNIIITEGELDLLIIEQETGHTAIMSVPNGAAKNARMDYLESVEDILDEAHSVLLATDGDEMGKYLEEELARRIGKEKCFRVTYPVGTKDANEVFLQYGKDGLEALLRGAESYPDSGVVNPLMVKKDYLDLYNGLQVKGVETGWKALVDKYTVRQGELTIVSGAPGSGKSEWLDALMVNLSVRESWSFVIFSPENHPLQLHAKKIAEKYIGKPFSDGVNRMSQAQAMDALNWMEGKFRFLAPQETDLETLLKLAHSAILQTGARGIVIDPWNEVMNKKPKDIQHSDFIGICLSRIRKFAQNHNVHFWVVAHPTKLPKDDDGEYIVPGPYDAANSANWFNRADNYITVWRKRNLDPGQIPPPVQIHIQKIRWKDIGNLGVAFLDYQKETGRFFDTGVSERGPAKNHELADPWVMPKGMFFGE